VAQVRTKEVVSSFRFSGDRSLQQSLLKDKSLKKNTDQIIKDQSKQARSHLRTLLGQSFRITPSSSPAIHKQFMHCQEVLHLKDKELHPFIYNSSEINAYCVLFEGEIIIGVSSEMIKIMTEKELTFIIGHEFGHHLYEHYKLPASGLCQGSRFAPSKTLKLMSWSRQAEISADRAGLLCCEDINAATGSFIKMSCGLGEPYVAFNVDEYLAQVDELDKLEDADNTDECYSTHPLNPLRVIALNNFWLSESFTKFFNKANSDKQLTDEEMDNKIFEILHYMDPESKRKSAKKSDPKKDDFLILSGYFVASADDDFAKSELKSLKEICGKKNVEAFLKTIETKRNKETYIKKNLEEISKKFAKSKKPVKCSALQKIITIARSDGILAEQEKEALYYIASLIGVKDNFIDQILKFLD